MPPPPPVVPPPPPMPTLEPGQIIYKPRNTGGTFVREYERLLQLQLERLQYEINPPLYIGWDLAKGDDVAKVDILDNRSVATKLDEVKSTVANLEGQVARLERGNKELQGRVEAQTKFVQDRALYVNQDGSIRNTGVYLEPVAASFQEYQIAKTVAFTEIARMELRDYGRDNWAPQQTRRAYRLMFSQGKLHVYQEV